MGEQTGTERAARQLPILFSAAMVQAILAGRKTQTRRIVKPQPHFIESSGRWCWPLPKRACFKGCCTEVVTASREWWEYAPAEAIPFRAGELLYVKEAWAVHEKYDGLKPSELPPGLLDVHYLADGPTPAELGGRYRHGRFMMRQFARLWLRVVSVRAERLNAISDADAFAEGVQTFVDENRRTAGGSDPSARGCFRDLWKSIHGPGAWERDPWVWRVEFERAERPV